MVEWLNRNILFKLVLVLAIVLSIKFYFDKKKIEEELLKEKLSQKSSGDGGDSNKNNKDILYYEIKKNLGELSEILGQSRDNLKQYSNLAKELGKYNSDIVKLIKNSSKDGKKISKYIDNTLLLSSNDEPIAIFDLSKAL